MLSLPLGVPRRGVRSSIPRLKRRLQNTLLLPGRYGCCRITLSRASTDPSAPAEPPWELPLEASGDGFGGESPPDDAAACNGPGEGDEGGADGGAATDGSLPATERDVVPDLAHVHQAFTDAVFAGLLKNLTLLRTEHHASVTTVDASAEVRL
jgi:hypothetical protein